MKIWLKLDCIDYCSIEIKEGKSILFKSEDDNNYIPEFMPGGGGLGTELLIDADTGRIINWQTCSELVRKFVEQHSKENKK